MSERQIQLNRSNITSMKPKKIFSKHKSPIYSLEFSAEGNSLVTTAENNFISVYDIQNGNLVKTINSDVYGAGHILWGPHPEIVIVSSTLKDNNVRYLSLYDNKYIREFRGHTDKVTSLTLTPTRDQLLTCSNDKTMRLWDIRANECTHKMETGDLSVLASIDPEGLVVAVGFGSSYMHLYDFRTMSSGPFQTFPFEDPPLRSWTKLKFSPAGNHIMINTNTPTVMLVDAFSASYVHHVNTPSIPGAQEVKGNFFSDYSSDEKFLFTGGPNGIVSVFDTATAKKLADLKSQHRGHVTHTVFNPKYRVLATASDELHLWA